MHAISTAISFISLATMLITTLLRQVFLTEETDRDIDLLGLCGSSSVSEEDPTFSTGRTPLHVAAASAAPFEVVKPLISENPAAAGLPDCNGETPLMLAAAQGKRANKATVKALIRASPHTVNIEDDEGMSALEYAILSEVPFEVLRIIQKSCAKERMVHDAIKRASKIEASLPTKKLTINRKYGQDIHNSTQKSKSRRWSLASRAA